MYLERLVSVSNVAEPVDFAASVNVSHSSARGVTAAERTLSVRIMLHQSNERVHLPDIKQECCYQ